MSLRNKAIVFHGFLGSGTDFESLADHYQVFSIDLKPQSLAGTKQKSSLQNDDLESFESWPQMTQRVFFEFQALMNSFEPSDEIIIISYSMGSKVLFAIIDQIIKAASIFTFKKKIKFIFLSTHFGLYETDQELDAELKHRTEMNLKFLELLKLKQKLGFIEKWNSLDLFLHDHKVSTVWTEQQIEHYFKSWNQSQVQFLPEMLKQLPEVYVFYGEEDLKYKTQGQRLKVKLKDKIFISGLSLRSHRLLQPEDLNFVINEIKD